MKLQPLSRVCWLALLLLAAPYGYADDLPQPGVPAKPPNKPKVQPPTHPACGEFQLFHTDLLEVFQAFKSDLYFYPEKINSLLVDGCTYKAEGDGANVVCSMRLRQEVQRDPQNPFPETRQTVFLEKAGKTVIDIDPDPVGNFKWENEQLRFLFTASAQCLQKPGAKPNWLIWKKRFEYNGEKEVFTTPRAIRGGPVIYRFETGTLETFQLEIQKSLVQEERVLFKDLRATRIIISDEVLDNDKDLAKRDIRGEVVSHYVTRTEANDDGLAIKISSSPWIRALGLYDKNVTKLELVKDKKRNFLKEKGANARFTDVQRAKMPMLKSYHDVTYKEEYAERLNNQLLEDGKNFFFVGVKKQDKFADCSYIERKVFMIGSTKRFFYPHQKGLGHDPLLPYHHDDPVLLKMKPCPER